MQELSELFDLDDEFEVYSPPEGVKCLFSYGPFKKGRYYNIMEESKYWFRARLGGKIYYTERWVFERE